MPWAIPFSHRIIGVEGYIPDENDGIGASNVISRMLDLETAFGSLRSLPVVRHELDEYADKDDIFIGTYRLFLSKELNSDWLSPIMQENRIISPSDLELSWQDIISTKIPEGVDIMIPAPRLLPDTILGQYSRVHHLDDLLFAVGCAVRAGLLDPISVPKLLEANTLIPYSNNFAAKKIIKQDFIERLWWCVLDFHKHHYIPRSGYQRRVIDFAFERIISMALMQLIIKRKLSCVSCRNIWISSDGNYKPST